MSKDTFNRKVRSYLPEILDKHDSKSIDRMISHYKEEGWTVNEVATFCRYTEEVNPELEEDRALALMARITERVKARLKAQSTK